MTVLIPSDTARPLIFLGDLDQAVRQLPEARFDFPIKVDLGSGNRRHKAGYVTVDANPAMNPDIVATLPPIPLPDASCSEVSSSHFLEHLTKDEGMALMAEVWRVLVPGGRAHIVVPYGLSDGAIQDPTHKALYNWESFLYHTPHFRYLGYGLETRFQMVAARQTDFEVIVDLVKTGDGEDCRCPIHKEAKAHGIRLDCDDVQDLQPDDLDQGRGQAGELPGLRDAQPGAGTRAAIHIEYSADGQARQRRERGSLLRRILFVWPAAQWSTADVARGYRRALEAQGHEIRDYNLSKRLQYHGEAMGEAADQHPWALALQASDNLLPEAIRHEADLIFVVNGHSLHPNAVELVKRAGFPIVSLFTESPYEDEDQLHMAQFCDLAFTNERSSAQRYGWHYLPHAYDPAFHHPGAMPDESMRSDVLMIASGWPERQALLEAIDWSGIDFKLRGLFVGLNDGHGQDSPLVPYYQFNMCNNESIAEMYAATKIALNHHRFAAAAESLNPRPFELSACGAFWITDERPELRELFGDVVPVYRDAAECEALIRRYLREPEERARIAAEAHRLIQGHTFAARAERLMAVINEHLNLAHRSLPMRKDGAS